jgi:hypothetical protein
MMELAHAQATGPTPAATPQLQDATPAQLPLKDVPPPRISQPFHLPDAFRTAPLGVVGPNLSAPTTPDDHAAFARAQSSAQSLFGGNTPELVLAGNPWKIINFGDGTVTTLFDVEPDKVSAFEPQVPPKALQTEHGFLFEMALKPKANGSGEPVQKRAVLVDGQGKLLGAECRTPGDAERLLRGAPWVLPQAAIQPSERWAVAKGTLSAFEVNVSRAGGTRDTYFLNNFGQSIDPKSGRGININLANYFRDGFDADVRVG